jgi:hypothetical protein
MARLRDRPLRELLILMIAGTVCVAVLGAGVYLLIVEVVDPSQDLSTFYSAMFGLLGSLLSVVAGFLAGQTTSRMSAGKDDEPG